MQLAQTRRRPIRRIQQHHLLQKRTLRTHCDFHNELAEPEEYATVAIDVQFSHQSFVLTVRRGELGFLSSSSEELEAESISELGTSSGGLASATGGAFSEGDAAALARR